MTLRAGALLGLLVDALTGSRLGAGPLVDAGQDEAAGKLHHLLVLHAEVAALLQRRRQRAWELGGEGGEEGDDGAREARPVEQGATAALEEDLQRKGEEVPGPPTAPERCTQCGDLFTASGPGQ